jgi:hypothetical protein
MKHQLEPELLAMPPRTPRRREGHGRLFTFLHLFLLPHTVVGLGIIGSFVLGVLHLAFGRELDARVVNVEKMTSKKGGTSYRLHFTYELDGRPCTGSQGIAAGLVGKYTPTAPVRIKAYALGPFDRADLAGTEGDSSLALLLFAALFWNGLMLVFHWSLTLRPLVWRRLVAMGTPVTGRIVHKRVMRGKNVRYVVRYDYEPDAAARRTREMPVLPADYESVEEGAPATVLYDPEHPGLSVVYRLGPYQAE